MITLVYVIKDSGGVPVIDLQKGSTPKFPHVKTLKHIRKK